MADRITETVALIVRKEVLLADERGYLPLNEDGRYQQVLTPVVAAVVAAVVEGLARVDQLAPTAGHPALHITISSKELADRFCAKIRVAEEIRDKRDDLLPESFVESMQHEGCLCDTDDAVAAVLLMETLMKEFAALQPGEIPASTGERHFFDTGIQIVEFFEKFDRWDDHELITRLALDGKYCVDVETT
jgi:hypothetical protein